MEGPAADTVGPATAAEPSEAAEVVPGFPFVFTGPLGAGACVPVWTATVVDAFVAAVVPTGIDEGVVTEAVVTGVLARTVVVGTVGTTVETVVATVGTVVATVGTVVGTVGTVVATVGTVVATVGTVVGTVGTVTAVPSGRAVASTFATKKPDTAKQTSTTIVLFFTPFISPSAELLHPAGTCSPPVRLVNGDVRIRSAGTVRRVPPRCPGCRRTVTKAVTRPSKVFRLSTDAGINLTCE
jgi:hypothetical protein